MSLPGVPGGIPGGRPGKREAAQWAEVEPVERSAGRSPVLGLVALGAGAFALWHGAMQHPTDNPEDHRLCHSGLVAGMLLAVIGVIVLRTARRDT